MPYFRVRFGTVYNGASALVSRAVLVAGPVVAGAADVTGARAAAVAAGATLASAPAIVRPAAATPRPTPGTRAALFLIFMNLPPFPFSRYPPIKPIPKRPPPTHLIPHHPG